MKKKPPTPPMIHGNRGMEALAPSSFPAVTRQQAATRLGVSDPASLTLVYDHHRSNLTDKMIEIQHTHGDRVVSSMHVHLTHDLCMELIALRGPGSELQHLAAELSGLKGIHQAQLVIARAGNAKTRRSGHSHPHPHRH